MRPVRDPTATGNARGSGPILSEFDRYLFNEGKHVRLYDVLGVHRDESGSDRARCAVWAPNAREVSVISDRNGWTPGRDRLVAQASSGIFAGEIVLPVGTRYKLHLETDAGPRDKADPFAFATELPPRTASVVADLSYAWHDEAFVARRPSLQAGDAPIAIYEVHLGSFARRDDGSFCSYEELADRIAAHAGTLGFTHVELLPIMEHPFYGSWGYQTTGFFAPSARYGTPTEFMGFVDTLHDRGLGVIVDFVPSHFATDAFSLGEFDGTHLYEHADPRRALHPDWGSYEFNYGRHEVRSFLTSAACFWVERYHVDALRVDAVASMLYLDYSRAPGSWSPNPQGGHEDLDAIEFLREMNDAVRAVAPGVLTIAEESTAWPGVTRPVEEGGLGFSMKWDMGWMHDTLAHLARDPVHRRYHYDELTFRALYAFSEAYVLPLSHDEVVHGKGSLAAKMPGDDWQRRANLRLLYGYQWTTPGKKLLFMGGELATWHEWRHEEGLEWSLLEHPDHVGVTRLVADLNRAYRELPALHRGDERPDGFSWVESDARADGVYAYLRTAPGEAPVLVAMNTTPVPRRVRLGVRLEGRWSEVLNTDAAYYGGGGIGNAGGADARASDGGRDATLDCTVPPLGLVALVAPGAV